MSRMTDETMARSVTDATMHDWLTAMSLLREAPPPVAGATDRALAGGRAAAGPSSCNGGKPASGRSRPRHARPGTAACRRVRRGYWWLLALALAAALVI